MKTPGGLRIYGAPGIYVQGPGALDRLAEFAAPHGPVPIVIGDAHVEATFGPRIRDLLSAGGLTGLFRTLGGEITRDEIARLSSGLDAEPTGAIVGVGGGKSLDAAKAVAVLTGRPVITVPTIASNDSPTSASIAVYDDNHVMIAVDRMARNPDAVLVDTAIIAAAPADFLRAGIGDAIAKMYEARGCHLGSGLTPFGTRPLTSAMIVAQGCHDVLRRHAAAGVAACEAGIVTDDLEATVEASILMAGLGFENGGLSLAHSLTRGLLKVRGARDAIHGQQIAWATLIHIAAEGTDDVQDMMEFHRSVGLSLCLADLGLPDPTEEDIATIARGTMTAQHLANFSIEITPALITNAIHRIEALATATSPTEGTPS